MDRTTILVAGGVFVVVALIAWAAWRRKHDTRTALLRDLARYRGLKRLVTLIVTGFTGMSVWLNVAHAPRNPAAIAIAAMIPMAVLGNVELLSRIPSTNRWLSAGRILAALGVGALAVRLSYMHQSQFAETVGYFGLDAKYIPIIIDGSMIVAVLSYVEVTRKVRALEELAYPSGLPVRTATRATAAPAPVSAGARISPSKSGTRGDYGPRGPEYSEGHQRKRVAAGKPATTPVRKPRRRAQPAESLGEMRAPVMSDVPYGPSWLDDNDSSIPVSPGVGPVS